MTDHDGFDQDHDPADAAPGFGLFDDADEPGTDDTDVDLAQVRDVLAGRRAPQRPSPPTVEPGRGRGESRRAKRRRRRRRIRSTIIAILVLGLIGTGLVIGFTWWQERTAQPADWVGSSAQTVVVRVQNGDGLYDIGQTLVDDGVVISVAAFVATASNDGRLAAIAPGYYRVHEHAATQIAVDDLANPDNRLGQLRIIPGQILADMTVVSTSGQETVKPGILSQIADACVPLDSDGPCFTLDEITEAAATAPLNELGIVGWAETEVRAAPEPERRLEGLILPGDYDIAPGSTARQALQTVVQASAARWNTTDIAAAADRLGLTPYQVDIIASLVQAEGIGPDMRKVARVIYNRLDIDMKLQFDSTVNYGLDRAQISTTNEERLDPKNIYSTYAHTGLPPTPIGAPGPEALAAADDPAMGDWLYFVAIDLEGNSCFSETFAEHEACIDIARANGVFG